MILIGDGKMTEYLLTLKDIDTGTYLVRTRSGSEYVVNLDAKTFVRHNPRMPKHYIKVISFDGGPVPEDDQPIPYKLLHTIEVGEHIYVEMMDQWLNSTKIQSIERLA
jgi:hypothetical protein